VYTLLGYFMAMFNYIFPASFRMQQRNKFDACRQNDMSALDFLQKLQDIADTIGDLDDNDVILAFFRQVKTYLRAK
jgi:hypothetical protein